MSVVKEPRERLCSLTAFPLTPELTPYESEKVFFLWVILFLSAFLVFYRSKTKSFVQVFKDIPILLLQIALCLAIMPQAVRCYNLIGIDLYELALQACLCWLRPLQMLYFLFVFALFLVCLSAPTHSPLKNVSTHWKP